MRKKLDKEARAQFDKVQRQGRDLDLALKSMRSAAKLLRASWGKGPNPLITKQTRHLVMRNLGLTVLAVNDYFE
jgi:hypothetical protein